jgi:hypothetical protein
LRQDRFKWGYESQAWGRNEDLEPSSYAIPDADLTTGTAVTAVRLMRMEAAKDYLALASLCEIQAAKAQDRFSRYQLLSFAESYRMLAESAAAMDRSAKALETIEMLRRARGG